MNWRRFLLIFIGVLAASFTATAQSSICTKTAQQLGEGPASAHNNAIVYLMMTPLLIMGFVGYRWWKREKEVMASEGEQK